MKERDRRDRDSTEDVREHTDSPRAEPVYYCTSEEATEHGGECAEERGHTCLCGAPGGSQHVPWYSNQRNSVSRGGYQGGCQEREQRQPPRRCHVKLSPM